MRLLGGSKMRYAIAIVMVLAISAMAGFDIGLGMTAVTESQSAADYGWTGTVSGNIPLFGLEWATRAIGTITYPAYSHHPVMTATVTGTGAMMLDGNMGMEAGGGVQYRDDTEEWNPVIYYGWVYELTSGHDIRPFFQYSMNARDTFQAGFLVTFGN